VTVAVLLYGVAGLVSTYGLVLRRRWTVWATVVWGIGATYAGTVAAVAYGGENASSVGVVAAGFASLLIAAATIWSARVATRGEEAKLDKVQPDQR
jgi:4-hydroxybenzoate polyprenyltransferase